MEIMILKKNGCTVLFIDFNEIEDGASVNINTIEGTESKVVLHTMSLKDVFSLKLKIPDYQRIYCWPQKKCRTAAG